MSEEIEFTDITDEVDELLARDDIAPAVAKARSVMAEADRLHAMSLATLRQAFDLTQVELAKRLGVTQANVAKTEHRHDWLVSTLRSYIGAIGGDVRILVTFPDRPAVEIELSELEASGSQ
jgi:DNA-binding transcriptional regulator YiaG